MTQRTAYFSRIAPTLALIALFTTSGCSTVLEGRSEKISVNSTPPGADCVFKQADDVVGRVTTPGSAIVYKTKNDLVILCSKPGYETVSVNNHSDMSLASLGNMVFGQYSFIGNGIDSASGADNKYDSKVFVSLVPAPTPTAFPAPPGAPPVIKLAEQTATAMSMQVPMPEPQIAPAPRSLPETKAMAIAAPVAPVAATSLGAVTPATAALTHGASPSLNAAALFGKAAAQVPSPAQVAQRDYVQALAESPRRPPFDVEQ